MRRKLLSLRVALAALAATALALVGATPAMAALPSDYRAETWVYYYGADSSTSYDRYVDVYNGAGTLIGSGQFNADPGGVIPGDAIRACDYEADGLGVEIRMDINPSGGYQQTDRIASTRGINSPYCTSWKSGDIAENTLVALKVCLVQGTVEYCTGTYYARA